MRDRYCQNNGRPSIEPEAALKLILAGLFKGKVRDRQLMREAHVHRARRSVCEVCPLRERCSTPSAKARSVLLGEGYTALLRARRRKERGWEQPTREKYTRHRWHVEGVHGRAKTQHGLARAVGRGLTNVAIQAYLTAAVMNLKKIVTTDQMRDGLLATLKRLTMQVEQLRARWRAARENQTNCALYPLQPAT